MLQTLRDKSSGWMAKVILSLLLIPFAFFGLDQYLQQRVDTFPARVAAPPSSWPGAPGWWPVSMLWKSEEIAAADFRARFEQVRQQRREAEGDRFDPRDFDSADNKREVLDALIDEAVLRIASSGAGLAVGDSAVRAAIEAIPAFQVDGKFDPQRYRLALASRSPLQSPREFEASVRENLAQVALPSALARSAFATGSETERLLRLLGQTRDVSYAIIPWPPTDAGAIDANELQSWYAAHARDFRAPETVQLEYVEIDGNGMGEPAQIDESALRRRYDQALARFVEPEQRLASHVLIRTEEGAPAAAVQAAQRKASDLAARARAGDFAALARSHSDDTGSKAGGGDLGWVAKGVMAAPFEQALFSMRAGEIRGPVKTDFGWHVIQLREIKPGKQVPFEEARGTLQGEELEVGRERAFSDRVGKLVDAVYRNPGSLQPAARELGLQVRRTEAFPRKGGQGIAAHPQVIRAAFSDTLIEDGTVSDPIEIGPNHNVLVRVAQHSPERTLPLAAVRGRVEAAVRADRAARAATRQADALIARIRGGETLQVAGAARQLAVTDIPGLPRDAGVPDPEAVKAFFATPRPRPGVPSTGKVRVDGGMLVFAVNRVTDGDPSRADAAQRKQLQQQLAQMRGEAAAEGYLAALRRRMKITVAEDRL